MITKDIILNIFKNLTYKNETLYNLLSYTDHGTTSPYHKEGYILTHLEMVYNEAITRFPEDTDLHIAAILHDVGKPFTRIYDKETNKTRFIGHESFSVFIAIDVLEELEKLGYKFNKIRILQLIQRHADAYRFGLKKLISLYTRSEYEDLVKIHICDANGRHPTKEPIIYDSDLFQEFFYIPETKYNVYFTIGVPNSGKSTFIKSKENFKVLSRDQIVLELSKINNYNEAFRSVNQEEVNNIFKKRLEKYLREPEDFIIDKTNTSRKSRKLDTQSKSKIAVVFLVGYREIIKRNSLRTNKVLDLDLLENFMKKFELPYSSEFSKIIYK